MSEPITIQKLIEASMDSDSLEVLVNGDENAQVTTRLGETYPSVKKAIKTLFENGGLPAEPFATKAKMETDGASLADGQLAQVYNETANNGLYVKTAGAWVKSGYDPLAQAKSYTDTAKSEAIATAATDAQSKADTAKSYAENIPKLTYPVISSNTLAKKLEMVTNAVDYSVTPSVNYLRYGVSGRSSFLVKLTANTTYTVLVDSKVPNLRINSFSAAREDWLTPAKPDKYESVSLTSLTGPRSYYTFTTDSTTNYVVLNFVDLTPEFIICQGAYNEAMFDGFKSLVVDKNIQAKTLSVDDIDSPMFTKSKNLVEGFAFGFAINPGLELGVESSRPYDVFTNYGALDQKKLVSVFVEIKPNTAYTISKEASDRFSVALKSSADNLGRVLIHDASLLSYTFTSGATDDVLVVQVSENYEQPKIQVEVGNKVTPYELYGLRFADAALPIGKMLNELPKQTDNTYIELGVQTDKFSYPRSRPISYTTATILDTYYEPLLADYPELITKNLLSKDASGVHDIFEYVFEPDHYEQTILLTAGMHPTEAVPPFALGILLNEIYRNPSRHEGLAYLRNKVKIVVIPVVNTWAMDKDPKISLTHYNNSNNVNISRNFPSRWDVNANDGNYNSKGTAALSEAETKNIYNVLNREKDELSFYLDMHTGQGWEADSMVYYLDEDDFLRPEIDGVVSMYNDIVRDKFGREPVNEVQETARATQVYYPFRVLGIPSAVIEYGTGTSINLSSEQTTFYVDQIFNHIHYGLKANIRKNIKQAERNEHNKQYISLYNTLAGHNEKINTVWTYAQWQTNMYDKLGMTRSVIGAASGTYELVKYVHAPVGYKNTVVLSAGLRGRDRKGVTGLGFFAYKLMTDTNPHIVALRNSTRFIFLPCLNPHGFDNAKLTNANDVAPYSSFATSTQPESVALRSFIDSESIDLYVDVDSNYTLYNPAKPSGFADLQVIYNSKADTSYQSIFAMLNSKYGVSPSTAANSYSGALAKSEIATYINTKNIAYEYVFLAQFVLPKRAIIGGSYIDYGYEANELAYSSEVLLNSIKLNTDRLSLVKYINQ